MTATEPASDFRGGRRADAEQTLEMELEVGVAEIEHLRQHDDVVVTHFDAGTDRRAPDLGDERQVAAQHGFIAERGVADDGRVRSDRQTHRLRIELDRLACVVVYGVPCGIAHGTNVGISSETLRCRA